MSARPPNYCDLKRRVESLERRPAPAEGKGKGFWEVVQILMPIVNGMVIALVGWLLTGAVEAGFKREQLQLSQVKEMRDLISTLTGVGVSKETALPTALTLSAYGPPAVAPLLTVLTAFQDEIRRPAAESALRALGLSYPDAACKPLLAILQDRSGRMAWPAYAAAVRLVGDIQCPKGRSVLLQVDQKLADAKVAALAAEFARTPSFDAVALDELLRDVAGSLRSLGASR